LPWIGFAIRTFPALFLLGPNDGKLLWGYLVGKKRLEAAGVSNQMHAEGGKLNFVIMHV